MLSRYKAVVVLLLYCLLLCATRAQELDPELRFINAPTSITAGEQFQLTFANDDDGTFDDDARIVLSRGSPGSLQTVEVLIEAVTVGQYTWNVNTDLAGGSDYYLQLQQDDDFGLFGPFTIEAAAAPTPTPGPEPEPTPVPAPAPEPETSAETTPEPTSERSASATATSDQTSATTDETPSETSGADSTAAGPGAGSATALADEISETASTTPGAESGGGGGGLSTGASAGVGVGVSAAALGLIAGALVLWRKKRKQPPQTTADEKAVLANTYEPDLKRSYEPGEPVEMDSGKDGQMSPVELDAYTEPQELASPGYVPYRPGVGPSA